MKYLIYAVYVMILTASCRKMIEIPEPNNSLTTSQLFTSENEAVAAVIGIYSEMSYGEDNIRFANGGMTILGGLSADELHASNTNSADYEFETNNILINNGTPRQYFWGPMYSAIYKANAILEGLQASSILPNSVKNQLSGEVKFLRAYCYFYLVNLFGDVPLVTTTSWEKSSMMPRTAAADIYNQIVTDLNDARSLLGADYSLSNGERIRVNRFAASALLSRVHLFLENWSASEEEATKVLDAGSLYRLVTADSAFLKNNDESIWQLQLVDRYPWATREGTQFIPPDPGTIGEYYVTNELLGVIEPGDRRQISWMGVTNFSGADYYYPYKFKIRQGNSGDISEYYTLLRLAEQYLIRGEARARLNKLTEAISDLNEIRLRAGLVDLPSSITQTELLDAVARERRIELFAEWGHRWLDLKRTGQADAVLAPIKAQWRPEAKLFPLPPDELQVNSNLSQNPGY